MSQATRILLLAAAAFAAAPLAAQQAETIEHGKAVYQYWCSPCHAPGPKHPGTQALEALYRGEKPAVLEERTDLVPDVTKSFVRTGVSIMPPFRKTEISEEDLAALAAYLAPRSR
jgi:mono/diheme cytochrome c family protein